jgi:hypothetical protein
MTPQTSPVHSETQNAIFRVPLMLLVTAVLLFGAWQIRENQWQSVMMVGLALIAGGVMWGLTQLSVEVYPGELRFGFPFWRKRFPADKIEVGDVETISFAAGIGIHFWRGRWVYNARFGRGVMLKAGKISYLLGSDHPERLQSALLTVAKRRVSP